MNKKIINEFKQMLANKELVNKLGKDGIEAIIDFYKQEKIEFNSNFLNDWARYDSAVDAVKDIRPINRDEIPSEQECLVELGNNTAVIRLMDGSVLVDMNVF